MSKRKREEKIPYKNLFDNVNHDDDVSFFDSPVNLSGSYEEVPDDIINLNYSNNLADLSPTVQKEFFSEIPTPPKKKIHTKKQKKKLSDEEKELTEEQIKQILTKEEILKYKNEPIKDELKTKVEKLQVKINPKAKVKIYRGGDENLTRDDIKITSAALQEKKSDGGKKSKRRSKKKSKRRSKKKSKRRSKKLRN